MSYNKTLLRFNSGSLFNDLYNRLRNIAYNKIKHQKPHPLPHPPVVLFSILAVYPLTFDTMLYNSEMILPVSFPLLDRGELKIEHL